jgi:KDO2-lipid IV(A) lauroyltransferase
LKNSKRTDGENPPAIAHINRLLSRCSLACLQRLARPLAWAARLTDNQLRRAVRDNLQLAYPDLPVDARHKLAHATLLHVASALTETAFLWHRPVDQVLALADESQVCSEFRRESGPCIIVAPHLGNWEFLNLWLAERLPLMSLYKPARKPALDRYIRAGRSRNGATLLPTDTGGLRGLVRGLREAESCMILPDQKPGRGRGQAEAIFFGRVVDSSTLVQQLVRKTGCPVYIAAAIRDLQRHRFSILVRPMSTEKLALAEPAAANYLSQRIESLAREFPEQYQWAYRRFRKADYRSLKPSSTDR